MNSTDALATERGLPYRWELIFLLWVAFFLHQADRAIYNVVLPLLKIDLQLTDEQLGLVVLIFTWIYGVLVPVAGYVGDVLPRKWVITGSLLFWSTTTVFTGLSRSLSQLIVFRGVSTGGGEAFYYPAANSLIGQIHHKTRALAMGIHQTANYTGIIASGLIAGYIAETWGWRQAFYVFGGLGVFWALVVAVRLRHTPPPSQIAESATEPDAEPDAESATEPAAELGAEPSAESAAVHAVEPAIGPAAEPAAPREVDERIALSVVAREVFRKPTFWVLCLAFGGHQFAMIGYLTWMPTFLYEKFGLSLTQAGFTSMAFHHVAAMLGVLIGGRMSDRFAQRRRTARLETEFLGLLLGAPFILLMGLADQLWLCYLGLAGFGVFRGIYDSNLFAAQFDIIPPRLRSSSVGLMLAFGFIVGAEGPWLLGWIKQTRGLTFGIASLSAAYLFAAACMVVAWVFFFGRDYYDESGPETEGVVG